MNVQIVPLTPAKLWFTSPGGLLGLKTPHCGVFQTFVQNAIMYVFIVVFYGVEFKCRSQYLKLHHLPLFELKQPPHRLKNAPKSPQIVQNETFYFRTFHILLILF